MQGLERDVSVKKCVKFLDEKVNASSMKSTNPGKGTTESGKQSTGSER